MTRLTVGQRLWTRRGDGWQERRVDSVERKWAKVGDLRVATDSEAPRWSEGNWPKAVYTDDQRARLEIARACGEQRVAIHRAIPDADLPTLNAIAALLGLPEVTAWTPEKP